YKDEEPWPVGADGSGASLSKRDRFNASSPAANWTTSAQAGGTPGQANFQETEAEKPQVVQLIAPTSASRWLVPKDDSLRQSWIAATFDDTAWSVGDAAVGYDTGEVGPTELVNMALNKSVIAGSGAYSNNAFDAPDGAGNFIAQNVTDG